MKDIRKLGDQLIEQGTNCILTREVFFILTSDEGTESQKGKRILTWVEENWTKIEWRTISKRLAKIVHVTWEELPIVREEVLQGFKQFGLRKLGQDYKQDLERSLAVGMIAGAFAILDTESSLDLTEIEQSRKYTTSSAIGFMQEILEAANKKEVTGNPIENQVILTSVLLLLESRHSVRYRLAVWLDLLKMLKQLMVNPSVTTRRNPPLLTTELFDQMIHKTMSRYFTHLEQLDLLIEGLQKPVEK